MNKFMIHVMIYLVSVISYIYLNDIYITPFVMCSVFIKFICCNRSLKDSDIVSQPDSVNIPFEEIKKVGDAIEHVVEDVISPTKNVKKMARFRDDKKDN